MNRKASSLEWNWTTYCQSFSFPASTRQGVHLERRAREMQALFSIRTITYLMECCHPVIKEHWL